MGGGETLHLPRAAWGNGRGWVLLLLLSDGNVLLEEQEIPGELKYEGISFE